MARCTRRLMPWKMTREKGVAQTMTDEDKKALTFEEEMAELDGVITRLESGELALEKSLEAYEKGVGLVRKLNDRLTAAEKRIEILGRSGDVGGEDD